MKNLSILIFKYFSLGLTFLREVKQSISCSISFFQIIINLEVISREFLSLTDLAKTQIFCMNKLTGVIMVSKNEDLVFAVF